jgi:hypothetical protein
MDLTSPTRGYPESNRTSLMTFVVEYGHRYGYVRFWHAKAVAPLRISAGSVYGIRGYFGPSPGSRTRSERMPVVVTRVLPHANDSPALPTGAVRRWLGSCCLLRAGCRVRSVTENCRERSLSQVDSIDVAMGAQGKRFFGDGGSGG